MRTGQEPHTLQTTIAEAMSRLHWELRDLFISSLQYGEVGTEADLGAYLVTGEGLTPGRVGVIVATLNDGLLERGDSVRI